MQPSADEPLACSTLTLPSALTLLDIDSSPPPEDAAVRFEQLLDFARNAVGMWGLRVGALQFNPANEETVQCIVGLAQGRQREAQLRLRARDEMAALQFDRDKYHSFHQQAQRALEDHAKRIGRLENENSDLKAKMRAGEAAGKREREEDRKALAMLRAKNEHLLHELKKKEQEVARLKDQLKKNAEKGNSKNPTFQIYQNAIPRAPSKEDPSADKYAFLLERSERELATAAQENAALRDKIGEMRNSLVEFNKWVDKEVFGEEADQRSYHDRFFLNHHLLFRKETLTHQLDALLATTRDGIIQLRDITRGRLSPPKRKEEPMPEVTFKRKMSTRPQTDRAVKCEPAKPIASKPVKLITAKKAEVTHNENQTPRSSQDLPNKQLRTQQNNKHPQRHHKTSLTDIKKNPVIGIGKTQPLISTPRIEKTETEELPFSDQLSEVGSHDSSIISHISIEQMKGSQYWHVLYQEEE